MTVNVAYTPLEYAGNGATVAFPVSWPFLDATHLVVTAIAADDSETPLTKDVHYTVKAATVGGTVTALTPPAVGVTWRISRTTPQLQPDSLRTGGQFDPGTIERMVDRAVMQIQEAVIDGVEVTFGGPAAAVTVADPTGYFIGTTLEQVLAEVGAAIQSGLGGTDTGSALRTDLATTATNKGAELIKYKLDTVNGVDRTALSKFQEFPSLLDFGAVGDGVTDDKPAFDKAVASGFKQIEVPAGRQFYTTSNVPAFSNKRFVGGGTIKTSAGPTVLPGNLTSITTRPTPGAGLDFDFDGDLSKVSAHHYRIGAFGTNIRKGLNERYFDATTTPRYHWTTNHSGWSGTSAMFSANASAGATTVSLSHVEGFQVGDVLGMSGGASDPSYITLTDTVTVTAVNFGTNQITFTPALSTSYSGSGDARGRATHGMRTMNPVEHCRFTHNGGGDMYGYVVRGDAGYVPKAGQGHVFFGSTIGIIGGDLSASAAGNFLTGIEIDHRDNGLASGCVGLILNFQRYANRNARGETWTGIKLKSEGSLPLDTVLTFAGKATMGVDLTMADFGTEKRAIGLKAGDRIGFNDVASPDSSGLYTLNGSPTGAALAVTMAYESTTKSLHITNAQITATGMHNNSAGMSSKTIGYVGSVGIPTPGGSTSYTPTAVNIGGVTTAAHYSDGMYFRVGNLVTVCGQVDIQATGTGPFSTSFTPPIVSTFTAGRQLAGTAVADDGTSLRIYANLSGRAVFAGSTTSSAVKAYSYHYTYEVL